MPDPQADYEVTLDDADKAFLAAHATQQPAQSSPDYLGTREDRENEVLATQDKADRELAAIQRRATDVVQGDVVQGTVDDPHDRVKFMDREFRIADKIGAMAYLKFASASDLDTRDPRGMAALYAMLRDCIYEGHPACGDCEFCENGNDAQCTEYERGDWFDFENHALVTKADGEDLFKVVTDVLEVISGRPTKQPGTSSNGRRSTQARSTGRSSGGGKRASRR